MNRIQFETICNHAEMMDLRPFTKKKLHLRYTLFVLQLVSHIYSVLAGRTDKPDQKTPFKIIQLYTYRLQGYFLTKICSKPVRLSVYKCLFSNEILQCICFQFNIVVWPLNQCWHVWYILNPLSVDGEASRRKRVFRIIRGLNLS